MNVFTFVLFLFFSEVNVEFIAGNFEYPIHMSWFHDEILIVEQRGTVKKIDDEKPGETWLDIRDKITSGGWSELADRFIAMYPVLFDARAHEPVQTLSGQPLYDIGIQEGMTSVGEYRDEYLSVDNELFRNSLTRNLSAYDDVDAYTFFKLVHVAYEEAQQNKDHKKCARKGRR